MMSISKSFISRAESSALDRLVRRLRQHSSSAGPGQESTGLTEKQAIVAWP
jgi:hypothetical protein